jgi:hypothetical protein
MISEENNKVMTDFSPAFFSFFGDWRPINLGLLHG